MKFLRVLLVASIVAAFVITRAPVGAAPDQVGKWSAPKKLGIVGTHGALLHTGKVLLYSGIEGQSTGQGSVARLLDPVTGVITNVDVPFEHEEFCSGVSVMPDGRVLVVGGQATVNVGIKDVAIFDPATSSWTEAQPLAKARYYPSTVVLPDGSILALAGTDERARQVAELEVYDPATDDWTTLPSSANAVSSFYPRMAVLPSGKVVRVGEDRLARLFDPATNTWTNVDEMNYGKRTYGGAVLLPGLQRMLTAGGANGLRGTRTSEILDLSVPTPNWKNTGSMQFARSNPNLVLLADGSVLAVGGSLIHPYQLPVRDAELYDPASGKWRTVAAQQVQRSYHSTAFLLPDGRVLSAGSDFGLNADSYEIYSPPYLFKGARPVITGAPATLTYGQAFDIQTAGASNIARVALIRPGAATHANNFDQRYVDLAFTAGAGFVSATAPGTAAQAPPGHYMLVVVSATGVPSVASFVHVS